MKLAEALSSVSGEPMDTFDAATVRPEARVACVLGDSCRQLPVVVTSCLGSKWAIIGVVTAFDLL